MRVTVGFVVVFLAAFVVAVFLPNQYVPRANSVQCAFNMRQIGQGIAMYANDHNLAFPDSLATELANEDLVSGVFVCPASTDTPATGPTTQATANALTSGGHLSYIYVGKGLTSSTVTPDTVLLYEAPANHAAAGMNVLFGDFHVEWMTGADVASILSQAKTGVWPIRLPATTQPAPSVPTGSR